MTYADGHPFHRSGQAALSDLNTAEWIAVFDRLEREAERFRRHESSFRSAEYRWPRDPLHDWSRCWEYPYAYYHLERFIQHAPAASRPVAVDVGSGVTFFPFALGALGYDVVCTDTDPICRTDLERAVPLVSAAPGRVSFRMIEQGRLPLSEGAADVATCISVLEHIPDFESTVRELARVVRPGGLAVLTNDLDLRGDHEIGPERYRALRAELLRHFEWVWPEAAVHPADLLRTSNGPYRSETPRGMRRAWWLFREQVVKRMLGRKRWPLLVYDLAVQAFVLRRKA